MKMGTILIVLAILVVCDVTWSEPVSMDDVDAVIDRGLQKTATPEITDMSGEGSLDTMTMEYRGPVSGIGSHWSGECPTDKGDGVCHCPMGESNTLRWINNNDVHIAVCDAQKVFDSHKAVAEAAKALKAEFAALQKQASVAVRKINTQKAELAKLKHGKKKYNALFEQIATATANLQAEVRAKDTAIKAKREALLKAGLAAADVAVEAVAKSKGIDLVLAQGRVIWASDSLDITDDVIVELNKKDE